jgi:hypothetical protein
MRKIFSLVVAGAALVAAGTARAQSNKLIIAVGGKTIIANLPLPVAYYHGDKGPADMKGMMIGVTGPGGAAENMLRIILNKGRLKLTDVTSVGSGVGFDRHRGDGDGQDPGHRPCRSGHHAADGRWLHPAGGRYADGCRPDLCLWRAGGAHRGDHHGGLCPGPIAIWSSAMSTPSSKL